MRNVCRCALALLTTLLLAGSVAAPAAFAQTQPLITFVDDQDLVINFERLKEQNGLLPVRVWNRAGVPLWVTVNFLPPAASGPPGSSFERMLPASQAGVVAPANWQTFVLEFNTTTRPQPGTFAGLVVATSAAGDVIRRKVAIQVDPQPIPLPSTPLSGVLLPRRVENLSLTGTNFLPSPLNPLWPTLLMLVALVLAGIGLRDTLQRTVKSDKSELSQKTVADRHSSLAGLPHLVSILRNWRNDPVAIAVLVGGLGAVLLLIGIWMFSRDREPGLRPHAVVVDQVPVQAPDSGRILGSVVSAGGRVGTVVRSNGSVSVEGIPRAGRYEGKMELGGETKVSVVVNDAWPYALLTIAAGVLVGYWITHYFTRRRPALELRVRCAQLLKEIDKEDKAFFKANPTLEQFAQFKLLPLGEEWTQKVEEDLAHGRVDAAKALLDRLETYDQLHARYREEAAGLHRAAQRLRRLIEELKLKTLLEPLKEEYVDVLVRVQRLLDRKGLTLAQEDEQGSRLKARHEEVRAAAVWIADVMEAMRYIRRYIEDIRHLRERTASQAPTDQKTTASADGTHDCTGHEKQLHDLAIEIAMAGTRDDIAGKLKEADKVWLQAMKIGSGVADNRLAYVPIPGLDTLYFDGPRLGRTTDNPVINRAARGVGVWPTAEPVGYEELHRRLRFDDARMTAAAAALAVGSGLIALYFATPGWGSEADYLKAFLWGAVLSEGVKYAGSIVARVWPVKP